MMLILVTYDEVWEKAISLVIPDYINAKAEESAGAGNASNAVVHEFLYVN